MRSLSAEGISPVAATNRTAEATTASESGFFRGERTAGKTVATRRMKIKKAKSKDAALVHCSVCELGGEFSVDMRECLNLQKHFVGIHREVQWLCAACAED